MAEATEMTKKQAVDRYMSGDPIPEAQRIGILRQEAMIEDMFSSSLADLITAFEDGNDE